MYQTLLSDSSLYKFLFKLDEDLATQCRQAGCLCGGHLHSAIYPRKPRGNPSAAEEDCNWRYSFCCAIDGCRRRSTPASFRFLGRRVFSRRCRRSGFCNAPRRYAQKDGAAARACRSQPPNGRALASMVAKGFCAKPFLESGARSAAASSRRKHIASVIAELLS